MHIDISKLPPGFKLEVTKEDLIAFADRLLAERNNRLMDAINDEKPIGVKAVAALLNVSVQQIYFLTSNHKIPFTKRGKRLYFFKSEILQWLKEDKCKTEEEIEKLADEFLLKNKKRN